MLSGRYSVLLITFYFLLVFYPLQASSAPEKLRSDNHDTVNIIQSDPLDNSRNLSNPADSERLPIPLNVFGPVSQNEALWDIATKLRPEPGITIAQMTVALFRNNPESFLDKNLNGLLIGVLLKIPEKKQIIELSKREADIFLQQHWEIWQKNNVRISAKKIKSLPVSDIPDEKLKKQSITGNVVTSYKQSAWHSIPQTVTPDTKKEAVNNTDHISNNQKQNTLHFQDSLTKDNIITFSLIDSFSMPELEIYLQKVYHQLKQNVTSLNQDSLLKFGKNFWLTSARPSPAILMLIIFTLFILLVYLFRKMESKFLAEIEVPISQRVDPFVAKEVAEKEVPEQEEIMEPIEPTIGDRVSLLEQAMEKEQQSDSCYLLTSLKKDDALKQKNNSLISEQKIKPVSNFDISESNVVNINRFLKPAKEKNEMSGISESTDKQIDFSCPTDFLPEHLGSEDDKKFSEINDSLDSSLQLKYVQNIMQDKKSSAFIKATESKNFSDDRFENDFFQLKDNNKIDVFIEEFEQLLSTLSEQTSVIEKNSDEFDNLIQFKLSIHFFKVLSEMMQVKQLHQFSQTVIDFLDDILDKKVTMTVDIVNRLSIATGCYIEYINCVKLFQSSSQHSHYKECGSRSDT